MYQLIKKQVIDSDMTTCWNFFSSPANLQTITPDYMGFKIISNLPEKMYEGMMIEYKVSPLLGIPLTWVTEIKTVKEGVFFVDEQRQGPYKMWHHEHHFEEVEGGVLMTDIVSYILPLGLIGKLFSPILVEPKLQGIFDYRYEKVEELFNVKATALNG